MRFFRVYQYAAPLILFPLSYWLWMRRYESDHRLVLFSLSMPILFAYVIPGLGTNWLRLWEFNTRLRLGRFRPHHGFVFGTATSLFALACLQYPLGEYGLSDLLRAGFVMGSVLAFWNWLYDIRALRVGFLRVYNRAYHEGRGPEAVATEYAPIIFGSFGLCYGVSIRACEFLLVELGRFDLYWPLAFACNAIGLVCPVGCFVFLSWVRTGETGLRCYEGVDHEQ